MQTRSRATASRVPVSFEPISAMIDPLLGGGTYPLLGCGTKWRELLAGNGPASHAIKRVEGRRIWRRWISYCKLACVNHAWRNALLEWAKEQYWLCVDLEKGPCYQAALGHFRNLRLLCIEGSGLKEATLISAVVALGNTLEEVSLTGGAGMDVSDDLLLHAARHCKLLSRIELSHADVTAVGIAAIAAGCPLESVKLNDCMDVDHNGIELSRCCAPRCTPLH